MEIIMMTLKQRIQDEMLRVLDAYETDLVYWIDQPDQDVADMIIDDINYNRLTLDQFLSDDNIDNLLGRIYDQDTAPREDFFRVIEMIQNEMKVNMGDVA